LKFEPTWPEHLKATDLAPLDFRRAMLQSYGRLAGLRVNFVTDSQAKFADSTGSSRGVSSAEDYQLLIGLRSISDVVITSGKTAKSEGYRASKHSALAIIAGKSHLEGVPALSQEAAIEPKPVYLVCHVSQSADYQEASDRFGFQIVALKSGSAGNLEAVEIIESLRQAKLQAMLFEAGPELLQGFLESGVVDEICLTTTFSDEKDLSVFSVKPKLLLPFLSGGYLDSQSQINLTGVVCSNSSVFTRWVPASALRRGKHA